MSEAEFVSVPSTIRSTVRDDAPEPRRTAPLSVLVGVVSAMQGAILPAIFVGVSTGGAMMVVLPMIGGLVLIGALFSYIRWRRLTYTVGAQDIRVESGVLSRAARSVPYERIQDVSLEQKLLPRLFGLVAVKFETGAGGGDDLALAYLTEEAGEELRQVVRARRDAEESQGQASPDESTREPEAETLFAMGPGRLLKFGLFEFSLAVFAVLAGVLQYTDDIFGLDFWDVDLWREVAEEQGGAVAALGRDAQIVGGIFAFLGLLAIGFVTGIARTFAREWNFLLERTPRGFRRRRGLFTKTDVVMPLHRVQGVAINTKALRYRFGWHSLNFASLASDSGSANHNVAPFAKLDEIAPIVEAAGFSLPAPDTDWHLASRKYRNDRILLDPLFFTLATLVAAVVAPIYLPEWAPLIISPLAVVALFNAAAAFYSWRFKRHALTDTQIMARAGLLSPQSFIATRMKLHSVEIEQGPIARLRGYATLHLGLAGDTFAIPGVPLNRAREVRRKVMETIAATDFSQLESQALRSDHSGLSENLSAT